MSTDCIHCFVSGRVQGVFFRASTQTEAQRLGLDGFVRNLPDGRVEVAACGEAHALAELRAWLGRGPPQASVDRIEEDEPITDLPSGFAVR